MTDLLAKLSDEERKKARETSMPSWMDPMLAKLTHDYFSSEDWIYERKLDGERVISYLKSNGDINLMSRNQKQLNLNYPEIKEALKKLAPGGCILDGEVVAFNQNNVSDFQKLQPRMQASSKQEAKQSGVNIYYYIFDCLYITGHDITGCGLRSRKILLKSAVNWQSPLRWTPHRNKTGKKYYQEACRKGWEGIIAKEAGSPYVHSRSAKWLKFKCVMQQEFVIGGFTEPHGERIGFGALLLGFYRDGKLTYAGEVGTGFDDERLKSLHKQLAQIKRKTSPYDRGEPEKHEVHFVRPQVVCEVAFTEWTDADKLRHPRFKGLRDDKDPRDVHKEEESQKAEL